MLFPVKHAITCDGQNSFLQVVDNIGVVYDKLIVLGTWVMILSTLTGKGS